jgi:anti-anti-sigma factor
MFQRRKQGTVDVVIGDEPLTRENTDQLSAALEPCLAHGPPRAVLDLQQTPLIDSAGLEQLLDYQEAFEQRGGALKLAGPNGLCGDILSVTGVSSRFEIFADVKTAVGSFVQ